MENGLRQREEKRREEKRRTSFRRRREYEEVGVGVGREISAITPSQRREGIRRKPGRSVARVVCG